ncbi:MAG TPA: alkaline phosphatase D family protein [Ideonella sp.]|uniref:alkaline phosphatase D family protein n=1 Tax=Ideonella sp. TaxID=1929293 RepID=UPI002E336C99|nr:alkaline phosphatase D family protein [Ideonella sp.]HEX5688147.1 alkaline phosphatase D family protein [Ideonella sp.]
MPTWSEAAEPSPRVWRRRFAALLTGACLLGTGAAALSQAGPPSHGPMVGAITTDSAAVWARWQGPGTAHITYKPTGAAEAIDGPVVEISEAHDFTGRFALAGLKANTTYSYTLQFTDALGEVSRNLPSYFRTPVKLPTSLSFSVLGDFMTRQRASKALRMAAMPRPHFVLIVGDLDHSDPARLPNTQDYYPIEQAQTVLGNLRQMRRLMLDPSRPLGADFVKAFVTSKTAQQLQIPLYYAWDDHDFCMNGANAGCPFGDLARSVYRDYFLPAADNGLREGQLCGDTGDWQSFSHGNLASFFLLDARSNRDAATGRLLGECQKQWLLDGLARSTAVWKFIVSPITFNPTTKPWDAWGAFPSERAELLNFIQEHQIANVIVLSADIHSGGALDDGRNAGLPEASAPHANMPSTWVDTYCRLDPMDSRLLVSAPGTWMLGGFIEPNLQREPVACLGMDYSKKRIALLDQPPFPLPGADSAGYLKVDLTSNAVTIRVMDADGHLKQGYAADGTPADMKLELFR